MTDEELKAQISEVRKHLDSDLYVPGIWVRREFLEALFAANAKLAAVPVDDIRALYDEFDDSWALDPGVTAVHDWLDAQVHP